MDRIRLGLIGVGSVVREIYQHLYFHSRYAPILSIEAAADPNPKALAAFCDSHAIPAHRRFSDYRRMLDELSLDAVQINTPDHLHRDPAVDALRRGLDVMLPKPLAGCITDAHAIIEAARQAGRLIGVDFHKRDDPRIREVAARYGSGAYGQLQTAVCYMLDRLMVANPNHEPRFFASAEFAAQNTPISFLTVHMADALMRMVNLKPLSVQATGYAQKLPSLRPIAVQGYDMCDVRVVFENHATAHILTGWHLPDTSHAMTVQSVRLICTDGLIDLGLDTPGCREITADCLVERNPLFRNFEPNGTVSGYGISHPGRIYETFLRDRNGQMPARERENMFSLFELGFHTTAVCEAAELSLQRGRRSEKGVTIGSEIDLRDLLTERLGTAAAAYLE